MLVMDDDLMFGGAMLLVFASGVLLGLWIGRRSNAAHRKIRLLQRDLEQSRAEARDYQARVTRHFAATAQLFNTFSDNYQSVYRQLSSGCAELCRGAAPELNGEAGVKTLDVRLPTDAVKHRQQDEPVTPAALNRAQEGLGIG